MMEDVLDKADKETGFLAEAQPLYIDEIDLKIKCSWCGKLFRGSHQLKHINQHVRKSFFHLAERKKILQKGGAQRDFREFIGVDLTTLK